MAIGLIVRNGFGRFACGAVISDPEEIAAVANSSDAIHCERIHLPAPEAAPEPEAAAQDQES
jgi:hypothetical protein